MERYELVVRENPFDGGAYAEAVVTEDGNYTLYADAQATVETLQAQLEQVQEERSKYIHAVGLATTCAADMQIDTSHPIEMMQEVCKRFTRRTAELEAVREQLRLANIDQANAEARANDLQQQVEALRAQLTALRELVGQWAWNTTNLLGDYRIATVADFNAEWTRRSIWLIEAVQATLPPPQAAQDQQTMYELRQQVEALQRERDEAVAWKGRYEAAQALVNGAYEQIGEQQTALDAEREKVARLEAAANYYKQPSKNGGVYSVSGGHIGNLMDWCKDNLKHCKFSGPDEDNLDLDLVQTAQQIPQLKTELSQLQALVRAADQYIEVAPHRLHPNHSKDWVNGYLGALYDVGQFLSGKRTLDATTPARGQELEDK